MFAAAAAGRGLRSCFSRTKSLAQAGRHAHVFTVLLVGTHAFPIALSYSVFFVCSALHAVSSALLVISSLDVSPRVLQ